MKACFLMAVLALSSRIVAADEVADPRDVVSEKDQMQRREDAGLKAEMEEIQRIREQVGIDLFQGTVLEHAPGDLAQFRDVYRRIAKRHTRSSPLAGVSRQLDAAPMPQPIVSQGDAELWNALGHAGRQLDLAASRRESSMRFDEAAQLRRLARKIRKLLPRIAAVDPRPSGKPPTER